MTFAPIAPAPEGGSPEPVPATRGEPTFAPVAPPVRRDPTFAPIAPAPRRDLTFDPVLPAPRRDPTLDPVLPPDALREAPFTMGDPAAAVVGEAWPDGLPEVEVDALEIHLRRAPTWRRVAAWAVDGVPFLALFAWALGRVQGQDLLGGLASFWNALQLASEGARLALPLLAAVAVAAFVYQFLGHLLAGATLGKWLLGLRVVGPDGRRPTPGRSAARAALAAVSLGLLGLGLLLALFTRSGRALHDLLASTWVVEAP